jgi:hypothetical protein
MVAWRLALPALRRAVPLSRLAPFVWAGRRAGARRQELEPLVARVERRLYARSDEGRCLERSLLVYRFLSLCGAEPTLVAGLRRDGTEWAGHAWVTVDGRPFNEAEQFTADYAPLVEFGPGGRVTRREAGPSP